MNRAGEYINALFGNAAYKAYRPNPLPPFPELIMDEEMISLLSSAYQSLGRLDATSELIPDMSLFLGAYVRKEALLSSQIEGTQATLEDVLSPATDEAKNIDVGDVVNYVNALDYAIRRMGELPVCNRLLRDTHRVLMSGVRGQEKNPGEFRRSQNWIGAQNSSITTARYVPPTVEDMEAAMSELEKFINGDSLDPLLKIALVHYQFETIHPFLDGNGRIGRMLIVLMLLSHGILRTPVLYMSLYLKTNRVEYYDRLGEVRNKGNYEQWVKFFLRGVGETCRDSINAIEALDRLIRDDGEKLGRMPAAQKRVFDYLKEHPIIEIGETAKALSLSYNTVSSAIKKMLSLGILGEAETRSRGRVFLYTGYVEILKLGT